MGVNGKRQMERFNLCVPAVITVRDDGNSGLKMPTTLKTKNICAGGAFMITAVSLQIGAEVDLELRLSFFTGNVERERRSNVHISGSIIRTEPSGIVIKFDDKYQIFPVAKSRRSEVEKLGSFGNQNQRPETQTAST